MCMQSHSAPLLSAAAWHSPRSALCRTRSAPRHLRAARRAAALSGALRGVGLTGGAVQRVNLTVPFPQAPPLALAAVPWPLAAAALTRQRRHVQVGVQAGGQGAARMVVDELRDGLPAPLVGHSKRGVVDCLLLELEVVPLDVHTQVHLRGGSSLIIPRCCCPGACSKHSSRAAVHTPSYRAAAAPVHAGSTAAGTDRAPSP